MFRTGKVFVYIVLFVFASTPLSFATSCHSDAAEAPGQAGGELSDVLPSPAENGVLSGQANAVAENQQKPEEANNIVCPVTGSKIEEPGKYTVEYKGKAYNLCCEACAEEFNKDPEKYSARAIEEGNTEADGQEKE